MKLIAHRGFSKYELENTKEAFLAAANRPYFGIETDISIIKNQAMILFHDDNLKRLTNIDKSLKDLTIEEAVDIELNARETYHTYSYKIAYPREYIRICKHYGKTPIIELKWGFTKELVDEVMKLLIQEDMYDKSIVICFTYELVLYIKESYPDMRIQYLLGMLYTEKAIEDCLSKNISIDLRYDLVTKELVDRFHEKGLEVNAWTVDDEETRKRLELWGVDYITTNILE